MTVQDVDYEDQEDQGDGQGRSSSDWATLRRTEKRAKQAEAALAAAQRELAFSKAGVDMEDPKIGYFVKGYDGELTPEAIRSAASEAGFLQQPEQPSNPSALSAGRIRSAASGASAGAENTVAAQMSRLEDAFRSGGNEQLLDQLRREGFNIVYE